jgi:hypothetical protein
VNHIDAGHHLEHLTDQVGYVSISPGGHAYLVRVGLGVVDELGNRLSWKRCVY